MYLEYKCVSFSFTFYLLLLDLEDKKNHPNIMTCMKHLQNVRLVLSTLYAVITTYEGGTLISPILQMEKNRGLEGLSNLPWLNDGVRT